MQDHALVPVYSELINVYDSSSDGERLALIRRRQSLTISDRTQGYQIVTNTSVLHL
jgi:hypothetical protein